MSTTIATLRTRFPNPEDWSPGAASEIALTTFDGRSIQLTIPRDGFIPLTRDDAAHLASILSAFASGAHPETLKRWYGGNADARDSAQDDAGDASRTVFGQATE